jgi:hypothetical protein
LKFRRHRHVCTAVCYVLEGRYVDIIYYTVHNID